MSIVSWAFPGVHPHDVNYQSSSCEGVCLVDGDSPAFVVWRSSLDLASSIETSNGDIFVKKLRRIGWESSTEHTPWTCISLGTGCPRGTVGGQLNRVVYRKVKRVLICSQGFVYCLQKRDHSTLVEGGAFDGQEAFRDF